jgi:hypothetical protein
VVPTKDLMAVTADARAQAAAGEGISIGRRVHTVPAVRSTSCSWGENQRSSFRDRYTPGNPGQIWAYTQGLKLMLESWKKLAFLPFYCYKVKLSWEG